MKFKTTFLLIPLVILFNIATGQNKNVDSLKKVILPMKDDTQKVRLLNFISNHYKDDNPNECVRYGNMALELAGKLNDQRAMANAYLNIGIGYNRLASYDSAFDCDSAAMEIGVKLNDKDIEAMAQFNIGVNYEKKANIPKALDYFFRSLKFYGETNNNPKTINLLIDIGNLYCDENDFKHGLDYYNKALAICDTNKNKYVEESLLMNISTVYGAENDNAKALEYSLRSLKICMDNGYKDDEIMNLGNIGQIYATLGNYTKCFEYLDKALKENKETGNISNNEAIYQSEGGVYMQIAADTNNTALKQLFAGDKQKCLEEAKKCYDSALAISLTVQDLPNLKDIYNSRSDLDVMMGNYKLALDDYKHFHSIKDTVYSIKNKEQIAKLETQRDEELKSLEREKKRRERIFYLIGLALALLVIGIVLRNFFRQKKLNRIISVEKKRSEDLLLNILPAEVADELKEKGSADAKHFDDVTVMFTDFKGFTTIGEKLTPKELINELNHCFVAYDNIIHKHNIEKIKTIGDAYMAVCGLPHPDKNHAQNVVKACLEIIKFMEDYKAERIKNNQPYFEVRVGVNSGPVVAGIVGVKKFAYDIWGDTVNTAARMEQNSEAGKINISGSTYELVKDKFTCTHRGKIHAKNKGEIDMYFVSSKG